MRDPANLRRLHDVWQVVCHTSGAAITFTNDSQHLQRFVVSDRESAISFTGFGGLSFEEGVLKEMNHMKLQLSGVSVRVLAEVVDSLRHAAGKRRRSTVRSKGSH